MADDTKSKLQEFRDRIAGSAARVAGHPTVQGLANATPGLMGTGALAQALLRPEHSTPFAGDGQASAPKVVRPPGPIDLAAASQNPAPFPFNSGPQAYAPVEAAPALPAAGAKSAGGVGASAASPFAALKGTLDDARLARTEGLDQDAELQRDAGEAKVRKMTALSAMQAEQAGNMEIDARMQQQADFDAQQKHQAFLQRNEQLANEIGDMKVDPDRLMKNQNTAQAAAFAVGSVLGGALRGLNGGSNDTLDRMDKAIDRDIAAQETAIRTKQSSLAARSTLFGQMLQETGDSRVAAMQTRNLMYESFKTKLLAEGERLGTDEARINAEQGARVVQEKQDAMREQLAAQNLQVAQQQAAAAAAARAQAEKEAWARSLEVAKLGQEQDKLNIERIKATKDANDATDKEVSAVAKDLADPKLAQGREAVNKLKGQVGEKGIAGVGLAGDVQSNLLFGAGNRLFLNDQERVNRNNFAQIGLAFRNQVTGSGGSDEEAARIAKAFSGANTAAEQRAALEMADAYYQQQEGRQLARLDDKGRAALTERMAREKAFSDRVKGGK